jgi:hypothetical protein
VQERVSSRGKVNPRELTFLSHWERIKVREMKLQQARDLRKKATDSAPHWSRCRRIRLSLRERVLGCRFSREIAHVQERGSLCGRTEAD